MLSTMSDHDLIIKFNILFMYIHLMCKESSSASSKVSREFREKIIYSNMQLEKNCKGILKWIGKHFDFLRFH